jgi:hypothetical protein
VKPPAPVPARAGIAGQLAALVSLRWTMARSVRTRRLLVAGTAAAVALLVLAGYAGTRLPHDKSFAIALLTPTAYLAFALLSFVAPAFAGGGAELFPADELLAQPVRPGTRFLASVVTAPLNLAWFVQLLVLTAATVYVTSPGSGRFLAIVTLAVYVLFATVLGQALAWGALGVWQARYGRAGVFAALLAATAALVVFRPHHFAHLLDRSPTLRVVAAEVAAGDGGYAHWARVTGVLAVATVLSAVVGTRWCAWTARRPDHRANAATDRAVRRRQLPSSATAALAAVDRASVWRSRSLRRGLVVTVVVSVAVTALTHPSYAAQALLPGPMASSAGLLYGINAFCLDGSGAVWLASMPVRPATLFTAKTRVVAELCALPVVGALVAAALTTSRAPTLAQGLAVCLSAVVCTTWVVAVCMRASVTSPQRAELRGARDTPAPPATMVKHSVRLATSTTLLGMVFSTEGRLASPLPVALCGIGLLLLAVRSIVSTSRMWADDRRRSTVVLTVAAG